MREIKTNYSYQQPHLHRELSNIRVIAAIKQLPNITCPDRSRAVHDSSHCGKCLGVSSQFVQSAHVGTNGGGNNVGGAADEKPDYTHQCGVQHEVIAGG